MPSYKQLLETFPNIEKAILNGTINIIPLDINEKFPSQYRWKEYQTKQYPLSKLKRNKGNYGVIIGYRLNNRDYWLGCLDIDGVKKNPETLEKEWEYTNDTREDLYEILSNLKGVIIVRSQSGGYHVYFMTKTSYKQEELLNIIFPKDYRVKELQGKPLTPDGVEPSVELFTNNNRQMATAPSKIGKNKYKVVSNLKDFNKLKVYDDIVKTVTELFIAKGYTYNETTEYITSNKPLTSEELEEIETKKDKAIMDYNDNDQETTKEYDKKHSKRLNKEEIELIAKSLAPYLEEMEGQHSDLYMALSGYLKRNGVKESSTKQLVSKIMELSNDKTKDHLREVTSTYKRNNTKQTGFNKFKDLLFKNKNIDKHELINSLIFLKNKISYKKPKKYNPLTQASICTISHTLSHHFKTIGNHKELSKLFIKYCENSRISNYSAEKVITKLNILLGNNKEDHTREIGDIYLSTKNNHKAYYKLEKIFEKTIIIDGKRDKDLSNELKENLKLIRKIIQPMLSLYNLTQGNHVKDITDSVEFLEKELTIKRTLDKHYYFNDKIGMYSELTYRELGRLIKNEYGYSLLDKDLKSILTGVQTIDKQDPYTWVFKNGTLNIKTGNFTKDNNQEIFTSKKMGAIDLETGEFKLFKYNPDVEIEPNWDYNEITLTQRTIQEILIPKNNKNYHDLYYDNLQRGGSYLLPINVFKKIAIYYNEGKGGKGRLKHLNECIMYDFVVSTNPDRLLNDDFIDSDVLPNTNLILVDEIVNKSFIGREDDLKRRSSGGRGIDSRKLGKSEVHRSDHNPAMEMYVNELFMISKEDPALLERSDFLKLLNKFVDKKEDDLKPNEYVANEFIDEELSRDFKGLEWLANARIKAYFEMKNNNQIFMAAQSAHETLMILNKDKPIQAWFHTFIEHTNKSEDLLFNSDIKLRLTDYIKESNIKYNTTKTNKMSIDIGNWMKETYEPVINDDWDNIRIKHRNGKCYKGFKLKTVQEVEKEYNVTYVIDEDSGIANRDNFYRLTDDEQRVFNKIKDNPYIHHKTLKENFNKINIEELTKELENKAFIKLSEQQKISV